MITGVVLARNEERNIVECLRALQPHVDEILLIDMESSDRTVELAGPYVAKVLTHPLVTRFDAARNIAIPEASFDWLWFVDADERIPEATGRAARQIIATQGHEVEAIAIPFKSYFCGKWIEHCGWWPGYTMARLLKRGHFRFAERIHGGVEIDGRTLQVGPDPAIGIDHYSYASISHYLEKANRYTSAEAEGFAELKSPWNWEQATREMMRELWNCYEHNQGFLDGEHGWVLSWLSGQYRWLSRAKILERTAFRREPGRAPSVPENLDSVLAVMEQELAQLRTREPELPLDIVFHTPIWDPSGYADEGRAIARALAASERRLLLSEIRWSEARCELRADHAALFRALLAAKRPRFTAAITNCIATLVSPDPLASVNVLRTANETDRVPPLWHERLGQFDEVWVLSQYSAVAFRRSGVPPEKLRVVSSCVDTETYRPEGDTLQLPEALHGRFVFLSVFDWQFRKGWDVLLKAYCREFQSSDRVGLLLKISRAHGQTVEGVRAQVDQLLTSFGQSLEMRDDILVWDTQLSEMEMSALYRSVDAFVLSSRGEGWGRPYMEAMASGLPTIGTGASGNVDFMNDANSLLVPAKLVDVSEEAAEEIPVFRGHRWFEPDCGQLRELMRTVRDNSRLRKKFGARARADIVAHFNLDAGRRRFEEGVAAAESRFASISLPEPRADQLAVELEGEFFAQHSFSIVNEKLTLEFLKDDSLAFAARQIVHCPVVDQRSPRANHVRAAMRRTLPPTPKIVIRHKYPPNWDPVPRPATWVHIQPWEFGYLPEQWLKPLHEQVDEVWAPSTYVRDVYLRSGIAPDKVYVIPWGIDPEIFDPAVPALLLGTRKSFRFLFVGGTIPRKGFDILLAAYLQAFGPQDDVCLVVKDMGTRSFYQDANHREQILAARDDKRNPEIIYLDSQLSEGQLASLYAACHCLVAPYRGEGFGLPIVEAMACGLTPIIPRGGPSDDFASAADALFLPTEIRKCNCPWDLCGPPTEFSVGSGDVAATMRWALENHETVRSMGEAGSERVRRQFTWHHTAARMRERIHDLAARHAPRRIPRIQPLAGLRTAYNRPLSDETAVSACVVVDDDGQSLPECLARITPYVGEVFVIVDRPDARLTQIAQEYGSCVIDASDRGIEAARQEAALNATGGWLFKIRAAELLPEASAMKLREVLRAVPSEVRGLRCEIRNGSDGAPSAIERQIRLVRNCGGDASDPPLIRETEAPINGVLDVDITILAP